MNTPTEQSASIIEIAKAMNLFQHGVKTVPRNERNPFLNSRYADLDAVWSMSREPLFSSGLALLQMTTLLEDRLFLKTLLLHVSGEFISFLYPLTPMRQTKSEGWVLSEDPQTFGSALTYARKYSMLAILGMSPGDDDDAEKAMSRPAAGLGRRQASGGDPVPTPIPMPHRDRIGTNPRPTGACAEPGHEGRAWAKGPGGRVGHPLVGGGWHWQDEGPAAQVPMPHRDTPPKGQVEPPEAPAAPNTFPDTPLGEFQRVLAGHGIEWAYFEGEILKMPWPELLQLGGDVKTARARLDRWLKEKTDKENTL